MKTLIVVVSLIAVGCGGSVEASAEDAGGVCEVIPQGVQADPDTRGLLPDDLPRDRGKRPRDPVRLPMICGWCTFPTTCTEGALTCTRCGGAIDCPGRQECQGDDPDDKKGRGHDRTAMKLPVKQRA